MMCNINESVRVKLTDHGRAVHAADHAMFWASIAPGKDIKATGYSPPREDADGWSKWQLWALMETVGAHTGLCKPPCFETIIEIVEPAGEGEK